METDVGFEDFYHTFFYVTGHGRFETGTTAQQKYFHAFC